MIQGCVEWCIPHIEEEMQKAIKAKEDMKKAIKMREKNKEKNNGK
jgi:hypothetical protein